MTLCEICGINEAKTKRLIPLWSYGVRTTTTKELCTDCSTAHDKGEL